MDTNMYERQNGGDMEVGSYAHRPILHDPDEIPSIEQAQLSPTQLPFTEDDFDPQMEDALELMPELLNTPGAGSSTRSTGCSRSRPTARRCWARPRRSRACGRPPRCGSRRAPVSARCIAEWMTEA
jgi:hypothetical protein